MTMAAAPESSLSVRTPPPAGSLAAELEARRLTDRAARIRQTLHAMHLLARSREGAVPAPLSSGIADFDRELHRVEQQLRSLRRRAAGSAG